MTVVKKKLNLNRSIIKKIKKIFFQVRLASFINTFEWNEMFY